MGNEDENPYKFPVKIGPSGSYQFPQGYTYPFEDEFFLAFEEFVERVSREQTASYQIMIIHSDRGLEFKWGTRWVPKTRRLFWEKTKGFRNGNGEYLGALGDSGRL